MNKILSNLRGRPRGNHVLRRLRSMIWYLKVRSVENLNDSRLDILFGPEDCGIKRSSCDRLKMFDAIRVNGSIPSDGTKGQRNFDLVAKVNIEPGYEGTAAIINSPFWRLLEDKPMTIKEIREMVLECVKILELDYELGSFENVDEEERDFIHELEFDNSELTLDNYFQHQMDGDAIYDNAMASALIYLKPSLDYAALLGALSFEAIMAGNMVIAASLVRSFKIILKKYCEQNWLYEFGDQLYEVATNRMLAVLNNDTLKGLPSYMTMLTGSNKVNLGSPIATFLKRHQQLIWRR